MKDKQDMIRRHPWAKVKNRQEVKLEALIAFPLSLTFPGVLAALSSGGFCASTTMWPRRSQGRSASSYRATLWWSLHSGGWPEVRGPLNRLQTGSRQGEESWRRAGGGRRGGRGYSPPPGRPLSLQRRHSWCCWPAAAGWGGSTCGPQNLVPLAALGRTGRNGPGFHRSVEGCIVPQQHWGVEGRVCVCMYEIIDVTSPKKKKYTLPTISASESKSKHSCFYLLYFPIGLQTKG